MDISEHVSGKIKHEAWKLEPKNFDELWEFSKTAFFVIQ